MAARLSTKLIRGITKPGRYFDAGTPGLHVFDTKTPHEVPASIASRCPTFRG